MPAKTNKRRLQCCTCATVGSRRLAARMQDESSSKQCFPQKMCCACSWQCDVSGGDQEHRQHPLEGHQRGWRCERLCLQRPSGTTVASTDRQLQHHKVRRLGYHCDLCCVCGWAPTIRSARSCQGAQLPLLLGALLEEEPRCSL
jgi:hypothetical protein